MRKTSPTISAMTASVATTTHPMRSWMIANCWLRAGPVPVTPESVPCPPRSDSAKRSATASAREGEVSGRKNR